MDQVQDEPGKHYGHGQTSPDRVLNVRPLLGNHDGHSQISPGMVLNHRPLMKRKHVKDDKTILV